MSGDLYPNLGGQLQMQSMRQDNVDHITQADLDKTWKPIFEEYNGGDGCCQGCATRKLQIPLSVLRDLMTELERKEIPMQQTISRRNVMRVQKIRSQELSSQVHIPQWVLEIVLKKADEDGDGWVEYDEFCNMILEHKEILQASHLYGLEKFVYQSVQAVTPNYYDEYYRGCCPPPLFIPFISLVEIAIFIFYCVEMRQCTATGPVPIYSPLIYDPHRRREAWRYVSYMFLHAGIMHIVVNLLIQLLLGIPLELVHKGWRIALVYVVGALMGGLAHSITDFETFLCGASGGVYALIGAHVANVMVNFKEMRFGIIRSVILGLLIVLDVGLALYKRYGTDEESKVGYAAHLGGFIGGLFLGIVCLKNLKVRSWERVLWYVALVIILLLLLIAVLVNTFYNGYVKEDTTSLEDYQKKLWELYGPK